MPRTDLGVLYRCATASTPKQLKKRATMLVPYMRTPALAHFGDADEPASNVESKETKAPGRPKGSKKEAAQGKRRGQGYKGKATVSS